MKRASTKDARLKAIKASKPNSLPGDKVIYKKEMRLTIKALLLQNFLNANTNEWENFTIKVAPTLKTELRTVIYVI